MGLIIFADWFDLEVMATQTYKSLKPLVGGSNIPSLNDLLSRWGIGLASNVVTGDFLLEGKRVGLRSGTYITEFPKGGFMLTFEMKNETRAILEETRKSEKNPIKEKEGWREEEDMDSENERGRKYDEEEEKRNVAMNSEELGIIGLLERNGEGRVSLFGDSACLDDSEMTTSCFWMLGEMLDFINKGKVSFLEEFENYELPFNFRYKSKKSLRSKEWKGSFRLQLDSNQNFEEEKDKEENGGNGKEKNRIESEKAKNKAKQSEKDVSEKENEAVMKEEEREIREEERKEKRNEFVYEWKSKRRKVGRDVMLDDFLIIQLIIGGVCLIVVFFLICLVVGRRRRKKEYIPLTREERSKTFLV